MKLMSARSRAAPSPQYRTNRAPVMRAARSKSRIPRDSPTPMGLGLEGEARRAPPRPDNRVVLLVMADRHALVGNIGHQQQEIPELLLDDRKLLVQHLDLLGDSLHLLDQVGASFFCLLRAAISSEATLRRCLSSSPPSAGAASPHPGPAEVEDPCPCVGFAASVSRGRSCCAQT